MKKLLIILVSLFFAVSAWAGSALQVDFILAGYRHPTTDKVLSGGKIYTFLDGTSTLSALWTDKDKGGTATNPIILDSSGKAEIFGDNIYKMVIYDSDDVLIETLNGLQYKSSSLGSESLEADYGCDLPTALASIGSSITTQLDIDCDCVIADGTSATFTENIISNFVDGTIDGVAGGATETLVINGPFTAEPYQIFGSSLDVTGLEYSDPIYFGASGLGSLDDTVPCQSAIDSLSSGGVLRSSHNNIFPISRTTGSPDKYGLKIETSDITMSGGFTLTRFDSIVTTGYHVLFIGVPDSTTLGDRVENIIVDGIKFIGSDTRHTNDGDAADDYRYSIGTKNIKNVTIKNSTFTEVDSGCIYSYGTYPSANYYLLQKSYGLKVTNNRFIGNEHAVAKRALIHAVATRGVDDIAVDNNYFEWIDDGFSPIGTFQTAGQSEDDTFTYSGNQLKRAGRNASFSNNIVYNTSEHSTYQIQPGFVISDNLIYTDTPTICNGDIKIIYGYGTISGNKLDVGAVGMSIMILARDVSISGNQIAVASNGDDSVSHMGMNIDAQDLTASYISALPFLSEDIQKNIVITGNVITMPDVIASLDKVIGIRVVTAGSQTLTAPYSIDGVEIHGNTISNYRYGIYYINALINNVDVKNNSFIARDFVTAGFNGSTVMNTYAPLVIFHSSNMGDRTTFSGNRVYGAEYMFASDDGSGSGLNLPTDCSQNKLDYIQNQFTSDLDAPSFYNNFKMNTGSYYLDRTWSGHQTENSLSAVGLGDISARRSCFFYDGTNMRWYTDDAGTFISF